MVEWVELVPQGHEMYFHDLEVMSLNPGRVELGVHSTSIQVILEPNIAIKSFSHSNTYQNCQDI